MTGAEQRLETIRIELEEGQYKADAETLARQIVDLAKTILGAKAAMQASGQGKGLDRQLERARRALRDLVNINILNGADQAIMANLMGGGGSFVLGAGGGWDVAPDEVKLKEAEQRAIALRLCSRHAEELGLGGEAEQKVQSLQALVKSRADDVLDNMGGRYMNGQQRLAVEANLYASVRLVELLGGPDGANDLRLKGLSILNMEYRALPIGRPSVHAARRTAAGADAPRAGGTCRVRARPAAAGPARAASRARAGTRAAGRRRSARW